MALALARGWRVGPTAMRRWQSGKLAVVPYDLVARPLNETLAATAGR